MEDEEAVANRGGYYVELITSRVTQTQLDVFRARFHISSAITMRAPTQGEMPCNAIEDENKILFSVIALECAVRLPLAPFVR